MQNDQPSIDYSTALRDVSAEQPGDRQALARRLERLPQGHPSHPDGDAGGDGSPEAPQHPHGSALQAHLPDAGPERASANAAKDVALRHADADPLRALGPAEQTHPGELRSAMARLDQAGIEVDLRPGSMSYSPSAVADQPGRLILDPQASYGALIHEMSHFADDEAAGFPGLRYWLEVPAVTAAGEERAYQAEIDYAKSVGETDIADRLTELREQRIAELRGEGNE